MGGPSERYVNTIAILLAAYLATFFEALPGGLRTWTGAQIDCLPALLVYCALSTGLTTVSLTAVLGGLWFDALSANPLGVSVLSNFVVAFIIFRSRELILRDQPYARLILGAGASAATPLITVLLLWGGGFKPLVGWGSIWQWLVLTAAGALITPLWFWLFDSLQHALAYRRIAETTFRSDREIKRGRG